MEPFFLPGRTGTGQRLCIHHAPGGAARGALLYLHPWAEEMNKSRRMAALQSRALAAAGYAVLQIDLHGCGDSSGDFGDASWQDWLDDAARGIAWLQRKHPGAPLCLWGLRAGALLATQAAAHAPAPCKLLLWQPALAGKTVLQQFLRLKAAAELQQAEGAGKGAVDRLRNALAAGDPVEVAGYTIAPALAAGLEAAQLEAPPQTPAVAWIELSTRDPATLLPASVSRIAAWRSGGLRVVDQIVSGPAFWQTLEIEDAPALVDATLVALETEAGA